MSLLYVSIFGSWTILAQSALQHSKRVPGWSNFQHVPTTAGGFSYCDGLAWQALQALSVYDCKMHLNLTTLLWCFTTGAQEDWMLLLEPHPYRWWRLIEVYCTCSSVPSESTMSRQQKPWDPNSAVTGKLIMSECNLLMIFKDLGVAGLPLQVKASGRKCRCWPATPRSWNVRARFSRGSAYQASPAPVVTKFPGGALRVDIEKAQLESVQTSSKIRLCTCLQSKSAESIQRSFTQPKKGAGIDEGSLRNLSSDKVRAWLIRAFSCRTTKAAPLREESTEEWPMSAPVGFFFCNGLDRKW